MKRVLSILLTMCMVVGVGVCGTVGANAWGYPWAGGGLKEFTAWTICSPLVVYEYINYTYADGSPFPYIGITKEMNENFLLEKFQQDHYAGICAPLIKNFNELTAEINELFALAEEHLATRWSSDPSTFDMRIIKYQEIAAKARAILDKIEWIDIDWTPAMVTELKAYYAENYDAIKGILEELGFDTSIFTTNPPPTTGQKWWQKAPDWVQWILYYLCFGWIWMNW